MNLVAWLVLVAVTRVRGSRFVAPVAAVDTDRAMFPVGAIPVMR